MIATIVTRGFGSFGTIALVATAGYAIGEEAAGAELQLYARNDTNVSLPARNDNSYSLVASSS